MANKVRVLSLFSGGGGLDIGFHNAGFDVVGCLEIDKPSCDTLHMNRGGYIGRDTQIFNKDITATLPDELGIKDIDFIIGGPPCQSFSAAGRRAGGVHGINDTRGSLFWYYCQYLQHFKPKGFLFENVKGILQANNSNDWEVIVQSFASVGYNLFHMVLDAADYGVPQHRERLVMVGIRKDIQMDFRFPIPSHGPDSPSALPYVTAGEAFKDIDDPKEKIPAYGGKYGHLLNDIPPGLNYSYYTEKMGHPSPQFAWRSKFSGFLYKLAPDQVSKTVVAHQGKYDGPFHWKNRKLNLSELKRLQSFPDDYKFVESKVEAIKQIGNSVAPKMANALAEAVSLQIFGNQKARVQLMHDNFKNSHGARKAQKAKRTKGKTLRQETSFQLSLLNTTERVYNKKMLIDDEIRYDNNSSFIRKAKLFKGKWHINLLQKEENLRFTHHLTLKFFNPAGCEFNEVDATIKCSNALDLYVLWDTIHHVINASSSYEGLQPLYGHFTEPYPKFEMSYKCDFKSQLTEEEKIFVGFFKRAADFSYLSTIHAYNEHFGLEEAQSIERIRMLREHNFDIRIHETNRAIKKGCFKACYPFSLPSSVRRYVTWTDIGQHDTGDVIGKRYENDVKASHPEAVTA